MNRKRELYPNHSILSTGSGEGLGFRSSFPTPVWLVFLVFLAMLHIIPFIFLVLFLFGLLSTSPVQFRSFKAFFDLLSIALLRFRIVLLVVFCGLSVLSLRSPPLPKALTTPLLLLPLTASIYYISTTICSNLAYFTLLLTSSPSSPSSSLSLLSLLLVTRISFPTVVFSTITENHLGAGIQNTSPSLVRTCAIFLLLLSSLIAHLSRSLSYPSRCLLLVLRTARSTALFLFSSSSSSPCSFRIRSFLRPPGWSRSPFLPLLLSSFVSTSFLFTQLP